MVPMVGVGLVLAADPTAAASATRPAEAEAETAEVAEAAEAAEAEAEDPEREARISASMDAEGDSREPEEMNEAFGLAIGSLGSLSPS